MLEYINFIFSIIFYKKKLRVGKKKKNYIKSTKIGQISKSNEYQSHIYLFYFIISEKIVMSFTTYVIKSKTVYRLFGKKKEIIMKAHTQN